MFCSWPPRDPSCFEGVEDAGSQVVLSQASGEPTNEIINGVEIQLGLAHLNTKHKETPDAAQVSLFFC